MCKQLRTKVRSGTKSSKIYRLPEVTECSMQVCVISEVIGFQTTSREPTFIGWYELNLPVAGGSRQIKTQSSSLERAAVAEGPIPVLNMSLLFSALRLISVRRFGCSYEMQIAPEAVIWLVVLGNITPSSCRRDSTFHRIPALLDVLRNLGKRYLRPRLDVSLTSSLQ